MSEWPVVTLGSLCADGGLIQTGPFGSQLHMSDYTADGVPVIMPTNIADGRVEPAGIMRTSPEKADTLARHKVRVGDIVYSRRGDITKRALIRDQEVGWLCGTGCLLVRPSPAIDPVWLSYWLGQPSVHRWLLDQSVGATMHNLNTEILSRLPVVAPPLPEQERIAGVLGAFDDLIETNRRVISAIDDYAVALAARAASLNTASRQCTFGDVAIVGGGSTPSTKVSGYWGGTHPWATPKDITALPSRFLFDTPRKLTSEGLAKCTSPLRPVGSVLMTSRATVGEFALAQVPVAVNQGFIVVNGHQAHDTTWLYFEMRRRADEFRTIAAKGSTFPEISKSEFRRVTLEWPDEEARVTLHQQVEPLLTAAVALEREVADLTRQRDELLPLLMSGRVIVRDGDEVSAALPVA